MTHPWRVEHLSGDAGGFHALLPDEGRVAWFFDVDRPSLVLGSAQPPGDVHRRVAAAMGVEVVRRRSGGGAVLMLPGEVVWLDLVIAPGDPLWHNDVGRSMHWVGELWREALQPFGVAVDVHTGTLEPSAWSRQVCFAGLGPGELTSGVSRAKVVGVSQRRTRTWARFQTMCHLRWRPEVVAALVAPPAPSAAELAGLVATVPAPRDEVVAALTAALSTR